MRKVVQIGEFQPIKPEQRIELERIIGESLPNGLEIVELYIPAGTLPWQLDDEYHPVLRYSPQITPHERVLCDALKERNRYFARLFSRKI